MKRYLLAIVAIMMALAAKAQTSGQCGDNLTWNFDSSTGTLTISGTGDMWDGVCPWWDYYHQVTDLVIGNSVTSTGAGAFAHHSNLTNVTLGNSLISIGECSFIGCTKMLSVEIPNSVLSIGDDAFCACYQLCDVTIGNSVIYIGESAFESSGITSIIIPNSVTTLGDNVFYQCGELESVVIGNSVTYIGELAFGGSGITSIIIPNSVTTLGDDVFYQCGELESVVIGDSVIAIPENAFGDCFKLKSVTIGNFVVSIGGYAFLGCMELENVTLGNSLESIGEMAFSDCKLRNIEFPNSLKTIGQEAFHGVELESLTFGNSLVYIGRQAFYYNSKLQSLTFQDSPCTIAKSAFSSCYALQSVEFGNAIESIDTLAFSGCPIRLLELPNSLVHLGDRAFSGNDELRKVTIPASLTSIEGNVFPFCHYLEEIIVDANNPKYDSRDNCNAIIETETNTLITGCRTTSLPYSVEVIGREAFAGAGMLTSIDIVGQVNTIGEYAFRDCTYLSDVTIGDHVENIGGWAFYSDNNIREISCHAVIPPVCTDDVFEQEVEVLANLYVPNGCKEAYETSPKWMNFLNIIERADDVDETSLSAVSISPNPASDFLNITCENMKSIEILSLEGKIIKNTMVSGNKTQIDISDLNSGVYICRIDGDKIWKIIKK